MSNLTHVVPGEPFKPAAADWNTFVDTARLVRDQRVIFKPGPFGVAENPSGCDCCPPCCGTLWYVVGDKIVWTADFYEGVPESQLDNWYSSSGPWPNVNACDADTAGNVYQCAFRSAKLETSLSKPQRKMYSLRSYDSAGNLQWSWAKYPDGFVSGSVRDTDYGTTKVRCGGENVFTTYASLADSDCHLRKHSTIDGVPIWDINATQVETSYGDVSYMVSAGPTRVLLTSGSAISDGYPVVVLDHDGAFVWGEQTNSYFMPVWIDDSDRTFMVSLVSGGSSAGSGTNVSGDCVAVYDADGTLIDTPIIRDGFHPLKLRSLGDQVAVSNGTEVRLYTIGGTGNYTQKITSTESLMVLSDRVGTKTQFITRLRSTTDLSAAYFFYPPTSISIGDEYLFSDAMPFSGGSVWCGRRVCGKTLEPETATPTTTSTTSTSTTSTSTTTGTTSTTTGSTTTGTTSTTTGSTTTGTTSTTTGSTTTGTTSTTTGSTTTGTTSTTTGSTTTGTTSTTTSSTTTASTTTGSTTTGSTTTASTTTGSTTTGSTTTASTTTVSCFGNCVYQAWAIGSGSPTGFYWFLASSYCSTGCGCVNSGDVERAIAIGRWPTSGDDSATISCRAN